MESFVFLLLSFFTTCAGFDVSVPKGHVVAIRGQPVILGCEFTPNPDLSPLVLTWQRVEDSRVVHSFYYQKDQLEYQSPDYRNRTSLFVSELRNGNATLRIEPVGLGDVGGYLCTVSYNEGTGKAQVRLDYGAFYTEPRLSISMNCSSITLLYEAEGYPEPEVGWFGEHDEVLSNHIDLIDKAKGTTGLYYLKSYFVSPSPSLNVTFRLKNHLLNQVLHRPVSITYGGENCRTLNAVTTALIVFCVLSVLLILIILFLLAKRQKDSRDLSYTLTNGSTNGRLSPSRPTVGL
ncbi:CD276 antigen [Tachysurus vachellii]|uniref:CD276 antigen n=1 Tax=Tachysurus vachellii TaxID=175792 RepID=UPI00296A924F|nr:CD276 antigen [Tachysurus vachellii]